MEIDGIFIEIERKSIKNLHLSVYPPDARVHVSAPLYLDDNDIHSFVLSKWEWLEKQRERILSQERQSAREYVSGESYYHLGAHYRLKVIEEPRCTHSIQKQGDRLIMKVQPGTSMENRALVLREWQRAELKAVLSDMIPMLAEKCEEGDVTWEVKHMKAQWGSCVSKKRHIILNLELARVPKSLIEYVVLHEILHLKINNHSKVFEALMDKYMPQWRSRRKELNDFIAMPIEEL